MAIRHEKNTFRSIDYNPIFGYIVLTLSHPREVSRTSRGWDRGRWPGNVGAKTDTPSRQPKLHGPGAPIRASLGTDGGRCWRGHTAMHRFVPAAVDRRPRRRARPPETASPPGVVQSRLQTPRAGRRRNGGLAEFSE